MLPLGSDNRLDSLTAIRPFWPVPPECPEGHSPVAASKLRAEGEDSDEALIARVAKGDRDALGILFRRYAGLVRGVAFRILRDSAEADDLVQELFLFIHRKAGMFDSSKSTARSWIVQMTYHRSIDHRRYLISRHFYTHVDMEDGEKSQFDRSGETLQYENSLEGLVGAQGLRRIAKMLQPAQLEILQLYFFEGYSLQEIAEKLDRSICTVRNHYYRALETLRRRMFCTATSPLAIRATKKSQHS
jgi:RNA polymerase sigma-70 factor (ECF subfamily)